MIWHKGREEMTRKYSLAHLGFLNLTPPQMLYLAKGAGYDYVGVRTILQGVKGEVDYDLYKNTRLFDLTKQAMEDTGIGIHDIELAKIDTGTDVRKYEPAFEAAAKLGVHHVISSIWTEDEAFAFEQFDRLCAIAAQYDINVAMEPVSFAPLHYLQSTLELIKKVNRPNAKLLVDTLHFHMARISLEELAEVPKELLDFAHICDGPSQIPADKAGLIHYARDERFYAGEGAIDIASMVKCLRSDTVLSLELPHTRRISDLGHFEHARRCLATCKTYLGQHGVE